MVNEEALSNLSAGMDVDSRFGMGVFRDDARDHRDADLMELMREPMADDGREPRKAENDLVDAPRGGVSLERRPHVLVEQRPHPRKARGEFRHKVAGA